MLLSTCIPRIGVFAFGQGKKWGGGLLVSYDGCNFVIFRGKEGEELVKAFQAACRVIREQYIARLESARSACEKRFLFLLFLFCIIIIVASSSMLRVSACRLSPPPSHIFVKHHFWACV